MSYFRSLVIAFVGLIAAAFLIQISYIVSCSSYSSLKV